MLRRMKKGQTAVEYVMLIVIILGAFLGMQNYVKRGLQGRWHEAIDGMGDQYDPKTAITDLRHTLESSTNTAIYTLKEEDGYRTLRTDTSASIERKVGSTEVGAY